MRDDASPVPDVASVQIQCLHQEYPGFEVCIRQLFSDDPLEYEDAYHWLTDWHGHDPPVLLHVQELLALLKRHLTPYDRAKVLELLGHTQSRLVIEPLRRHLRHPDSQVRLWAVLSLQQLDFPETRMMLAKFGPNIQTSCDSLQRLKDRVRFDRITQHDSAIGSGGPKQAHQVIHPLTGERHCLEDIFSKDPNIFEDTFECLTEGDDPPVKQHVEELLGFLERELSPFDRGKVLELLGYSETRQVIEALENHLSHAHQEARIWAVHALDRLDFPETRNMVADFKAKFPDVLGKK